MDDGQNNGTRNVFIPRINFYRPQNFLFSTGVSAPAGAICGGEDSFIVGAVHVTSAALYQRKSALHFGRRVRVTHRLRGLKISVVRLPTVRGIQRSALLIHAITSFIGGTALSITTNVATSDVRLTTTTLRKTTRPYVHVRLPMSPINVSCAYHGGPSNVLG